MDEANQSCPDCGGTGIVYDDEYDDYGRICISETPKVCLCRYGLDDQQDINGYDD